jgi:hypothetical protein
LSRQELAELANPLLSAPISGHYIGRLERGEFRWPGVHVRRALRHVLGAASDTDLGFFILRPQPTARARPAGSPGSSACERLDGTRPGGVYADEARADATRADATRADATRADGTRADEARVDEARVDGARVDGACVDGTRDAPVESATIDLAGSSVRVCIQVGQVRIVIEPGPRCPGVSQDFPPRDRVRVYRPADVSPRSPLRPRSRSTRRLRRRGTDGNADPQPAL